MINVNVRFTNDRSVDRLGRRNTIISQETHTHILTHTPHTQTVQLLTCGLGADRRGCHTGLGPNSLHGALGDGIVYDGVTIGTLRVLRGGGAVVKLGAVVKVQPGHAAHELLVALVQQVLRLGPAADA